jgi:hypothetical protein
LFAEVGLKPDFHTATIRNMADSGGHNPSATLLSENPGVDLKMFAGGGASAAAPEGGYDNSATLLRAPADPVPVLKFSGGGDFNFVEDVLGLTQSITELDGISTLDAIKALSEDTLNTIYKNLLESDVKFADFLNKKGSGSLINENVRAVDEAQTAAE